MEPTACAGLRVTILWELFDFTFFFGLKSWVEDFKVIVQATWPFKSGHELVSNLRTERKSAIHILVKTLPFKPKEAKLGCSSLSESLFNCGYSSGFNL